MYKISWVNDYKSMRQPKPSLSDKANNLNNPFTLGFEYPCLRVQLMEMIGL